MSSPSLLRVCFVLALAVLAAPDRVIAGDERIVEHELGSSETDAESSALGALQSKVTPKQAIQDGLVWLARHQNPDGSWGAETLKDRCTPGKPCAVAIAKHPFVDFYNEGITALAILSFLRAGFGPDDKHELVDAALQKRYKCGEVVGRALEWLKKRQNSQGSFQGKIGHSFVYNEATATLAMIEAFSASKSDVWKVAAQRGVDFIQAAQRPNPTGDGLWGWRYAPRAEVEDGGAGLLKVDKAKAEAFRKELSQSDTSATAWCASVVSAASDAGLQVKKEVFDGAIDFCNFVSLTDGRVGYTNPSEAGIKVTGANDQYTYHPAVMSALGLVIRLYANHDRKHPFFELAAQKVVQDLPTVSADKLSIDYYYWYEASLALNHFDGERSGSKSKKKYSGPWNKAATQALLELQDHAKGACSNGGWITPDRWSYTGGAVYCTAMGVLSLEACNPK